jgi:hypothetical protein
MAARLALATAVLAQHSLAHCVRHEHPRDW